MTETTIPLIKPDWALGARVRVISTTRLGGLSESPYDSLNLGLHVGDDEHDVRNNRRKLQTAAGFPSEPCWLNQVHGINVCRFDPDQAQPDNKADASWTDVSGKVIAVVTADCLPVVIANESETAVAVAHAGWRGLVAGVLQRTCQQFAASDRLHAWLGPAIGPLAFEVGSEVQAAFVDVNADNQNAFTPQQAEGKYLADIYQLARIELARCGVTAVTGGECCTHTEANRFFSHRRDGARTGRMATFAWLA